MVYPLSIGSVIFNQGPFEGPNGDGDGLGDLGSKQKANVREFPGGIITAQLYGSYPKLIEWSGKLFHGNAFNRSMQLQKLADNGELVTFKYAQWNYDGFVEDYTAHVKGFNIVDYRIRFRPLQNNSTVAGSGPGFASSDPFANTVSNAQTVMQRQSTAPSSGALLPNPVQSGTGFLNQSVNKALQASGGSVSAMPPATLQGLVTQVSSLRSLLGPIITTGTPALSSAAADLDGTLSILETAFRAPLNPLITTISAVNPNLYELAARFYSDPAKYELIQNASGLLDPLPVTNGPITVKIPVKPVDSTDLIPATVINNVSAAA